MQSLTGNPWTPVLSIVLCSVMVCFHKYVRDYDCKNVKKKKVERYMHNSLMYRNGHQQFTWTQRVYCLQLSGFAWKKDTK